MDVIFLRESKNFLEALNKYTKGEITYFDLGLARIKYETSKFESVQNMKEYIHEFKLKEYKKTLEYEKIIEESKSCLTICDKNITLNEILSRGEILGLTKKSEYGSVLPAFPTLNMMTLDIKDEENIQDTKEEEFLFEF